ncbi:MAG: helix-turn-helix domain-containing protein [Spirochaetaceae bacterium]|jgi:transcriptional regulator with XRE-family HTH domain|nr:helix-turn-helix domain-containing protein [Spirochaetaceae bacterium]
MGSIENQLNFVIERIKNVRLQKSISQLELSLRSHLSLSFIASIETGKKQPSVLTLLKIADALEVSPRIFFPEYKNMSKREIKDEIESLLAML